MATSLSYAGSAVNSQVRRTLLLGLVAALVLLGTGGQTTSAPFAGAQSGALTSVIVREQAGSGDGPEQAVAYLGGTVGNHISIINGFVAEIPAGALGYLASMAGVYAVTPNGEVALMGDRHGDEHFSSGIPGDGLGYADASEISNTYAIDQAIGASDLWHDGYSGKGIGVALIDSGVVNLPELAGRVINGPDLSLESQDTGVRYLDTYGHGTHMAGIIAGKDPKAANKKADDYRNSTYYMGIAPDAKIISIKVANYAGITDVSQVIAAIDWVVTHKNDNGMNIRVLNLSFGTDATQSYMLDPLAYAAEIAWRNGIVVVVAGGNAGFGSTSLNNPALDPFVIAVGASDMAGTIDTNNDTVATYSSSGNATRRPDFVAPGRVTSLRDAGSYLDQL